MPLDPGEGFADFTIVRLLGSGCTGTVYLASRVGSPERVALKILRAEVSSAHGFRTNFFRDVDLAASLHHTSIAAIRDRGDSEGRLWLATEYVDGPDIDAVIRADFPDGLAPAQAFLIVSRIADALDFAHENGVIHGHVKPTNIVIADPASRHFRIALTDFGLGRWPDTAHGRPSAYAAPEQISRSAPNGRADQYGLAGVAFHLLTAASPSEQRSGDLASRHPHLGDLTPVFERAFAKDPSARFNSCRDLANALIRAQDSDVVVPTATARFKDRTNVGSNHPRASPHAEIYSDRDEFAIPAAEPAAPPARSLVLPVAGALVVTILLVIGGLLIGKPHPSKTAPPQAPPQAAPPSATVTAPTAPLVAPACGDPASVAESLPPQDKLAQLLMVGVTGIEDARSVVANHHVGGIFIGSWTDLGMLRDGSLRQLEDATGPLPLAVSVDEEGGRVERLANFLGSQPSPRSLAKSTSSQEVEAIAQQRGKTMKDLGITIDFAPVVDVSDAPDDTVIGDRSFGDTAQVVAEFAGAYADGLRQAGLLPVLKHFPGHGHASGDSHQGGVTTPPLDQLMKDDLIPYRTLTQSAPVAVMVGHMQVPDLTSGEPASLSKPVYDLLRSGRYGGAAFSGLVFTDDLSSMGAINQRYTVPDAVLRALQAGADTALWVSTDQVPAVLDRLQQALNSGELSMARVDEALRRVALAKGPHPKCGQ
ncbi:beta-glucosidase-like glycosyl hydrolase/serine/threonine protein kinase [Mycobacterium sp. OAS707]|nr:beta-glucosidase-like glycosyl hydrolase/serine/threonine protein kinase [Mycobacterium sp. OAS707]